MVGALLLTLVATLGVVLLADPGAAKQPLEKIRAPLAISLVEQANRGCGGVRSHTWERGYWRCVFSEDFDGDALDLTHWNPVTTAASGFSTGVPPGYVCFIYDPRTVSVASGTLRLAIVRDKKFECGGPAMQPTRFIGGAVSTKHRLALTYGRFEVRARFPTSDKPGLHSSIQLRPAERAYGGASGEIDIAEYFSARPKKVFPSVRYSHRGPDPTATNNKCRLSAPAAFHTYTAQWTPDRIELQVDGRTCVSTAWTLGTELARPAPFDKPFFLALFQGLGASDVAYDATTKPTFPVVMEIDYVHIWGHVED